MFSLCANYNICFLFLILHQRNIKYFETHDADNYRDDDNNCANNDYIIFPICK